MSTVVADRTGDDLLDVTGRQHTAVGRDDMSPGSMWVNWIDVKNWP